MLRKLSTIRKRSDSAAGSRLCEHRTVSKEGRIVCRKIVEGEGEVSPNVCRACPARAVNCAQLRFSLRQSTPSPLIVRFNGRTEVWDDGPPELHFERAACAARVVPIEHPRACAGCALREPVRAPAEQQVPAGAGKVVPFPQRERVAAAS
ncbi:MAG: hypothetical protein PVH17_08770 [Anaerolineae bacterium]|jgi:hypothetical protein